MYADIAPENWEASGALSDSSLASRLIVGGNSGGADGIYAVDYDVDEHPIARTLDLPLDADSSQQSAIADIAEGKSLVIEGPPGTGKSQTIANAIANAMHQGKTVLFVAEKHAALEVVQKRLTNAGLGDFCLDLHGHAVAPKKVMESLAKRLTRSLGNRPSEVDSKKRLESCKQILGNYLKDTAKIVGPYREPLYDLFWRVVRIRQSGCQSLRKVECDVAIELDGFEQATASLQSFQHSLKDFQNPKDSAWWGFFPTELTPNEAERILEALPRFKDLALRLEKNVQQSTKLLGCTNGTARDFLCKANISELTRLGSAKLNFERIGIDRLANPKNQQFGIELQQAFDNFNKTKTILAKKLLVDAPEASAILGSMDADFWNRLEEFPKSLQIRQLQEIRIWAETTFDLTFKFVDRVKSMNQFGFVDVDRFDEFERAVQQIHLIQHSINVNQPSVSQSIHYDSAKTVLGIAKVKWDSLTKRKQEIVAVFHIASVPDGDKLIAILKKFRASYNSYFRLFNKDYRQSRAEIKQFANFPKKYSAKQILSALESLERFEKDKKEFENDDSLKKLLGDFFKGLDSDWDRIKTLMAWLQTARKLGLDPARINALLPQRDELCLKFSVKELNLEIEHIKAQLSSEHSKSAGFRIVEVGNFRIDGLATRLKHLVEQLRQIDSVSRLLSDGRNATLADVKLLEEHMDLHRASLTAIENASASTVADEFTISSAIQSKQIDFTALVDWVNAFQKLKLGVHAFENLSKTSPSNFCEELASKCIDTRNTLCEWSKQRQQVFSTAELHKTWLCPTKNEVLLSDVISMVERLESERERLPAWISVCRSYSRCRRSGVSAFAMAGIENQMQGNDFAAVYRMTLLERIAEQELLASKIGFDFTTAEMEDTRRSFQSIDRACDQDRSVAEAVGVLRALDDDLFVKNLESIQGDERDVMFISYTYGPDPTTGRVFQRFGPINSEMGWRRLNVMVTRARKRMEIFTSLKPGDIHSGPDKSRGINSYKEFLEYAETGRMLEAGSESGREPGSPFEESVAKVVLGFGLEPVFQIGVAGYFIDIGVRRPGEQGDFILGIECDGATYHSSRSARDRDRLREEVIRMRGWSLHRIWSTEWFLNQRQEEIRLQRVLEAMLDENC